MLKKILYDVQKYHMIEEGDTIVAGVSGGADSVCLLFVLLEIQRQIPFTVEVVHINHGIRKEAGEDARFVEELCREKKLPFHLVEENIKARAKQTGRSEEEEGRLVRYGAFEKVLGNRQGKIAVAHNSNDRAETMLFHLFRGTGLLGAASIRPVNGKIIRPLLGVERKEIEAFLAERNITFCTDCTNEQDIYTRNRIRHHILNYAEENICHGTVGNMNRAAEHLWEAEAYLTRQTLEAVKRCVTINEKPVELQTGEETERKRELSVKLYIPAFLKEEEYLQGRILLWCLEQAAESRKDLTSAHIYGIRHLLNKQGNGQLHLPYGLTVYKKYDWGMIERRIESGREEESFREEAFLSEYQVSLPFLGEVNRLEIPGLGIVEITAFLREESQNIPEKTYTKWFDYDKITKSVTFRTRRKGDYLTVNCKLGRKSLQDYFVNEKVPREERDKRFLLTDGEHVLWVPGHRISEYFKISEETKRILQVSILENMSKEERSHFNG